MSESNIFFLISYLLALAHLLVHFCICIHPRHKSSNIRSPAIRNESYIFSREDRSLELRFFCQWKKSTISVQTPPPYFPTRVQRSEVLKFKWPSKFRRWKSPLVFQLFSQPTSSVLQFNSSASVARCINAGSINIFNGLLAGRGRQTNTGVTRRAWRPRRWGTHTPLLMYR